MRVPGLWSFTLAGDPRVERLQLLSQRLDLANAAALLVSVLVEGEHALLAHQLGHRVLVGEGELDLDVEVLLDVVEELVRLGVQPTGVEGEDAKGAAGELGVLDQRDVLGAGEGDGEAVAEELEGFVHDLHHGLVLELGIEIGPVDAGGGACIG